MINQEIVTYLKSEKDIKKGFALLDKEKKKDIKKMKWIS